MKNSISRLIQLAAAGIAFASFTLSPPAHSIETTCTSSGGVNCPALIPDGPLPGVASTVIVPANICGAAAPTGASVRVNLTHSWIGDLSLSVKNPIGATSTLLNPLSSPPAVSCAGDDIVAIFKDGSPAPTCQSASIPALTGTFAPVNTLTPLASSVVGTWTLTVTDNMHGNNGQINDWAVDVTCAAAASASADMGVSLSGFPGTAAPNSSVNGTVTCSSLGGQAATNATCAVSGGTASSCVLHPANTPIASFPVASVPVGGSITCAVNAPSDANGVVNVSATTSADVDSNVSNNAAAFSIAPQSTGDMAVVLSGFPAGAAPGANVAGTVTCINVGTVAAANAVCNVAAATASNCVQNPGNTPVASFPVASVAVGGSIVCSVAGSMPLAGPLAVTGLTDASNDVNDVNNTATINVASQLFVPPTAVAVPAPALSWWMQAALLGLLFGSGVWLSRSRKLS